ncbi:MAG: HAD-IA family hydrolase [Legionella sp.]|nr:HAD-IA family hydrolase [Legionella sp.]
MNKIYRLIVFDWEGTLGDNFGQIVSIITKETQRLHLGTVAESDVRESIPFGLIVTIKKILPHLTVDQQENLLAAINQGLMTRNMEVFLMPGAKDFVQAAHQAGKRLAIATNKSQQSLVRALNASGIAPLFELTRSAGQTPPKPDPQMLSEILEALDIPAEAALMIGDSVSDIEMAGYLNMDAIGMDFYHLQTANLKEAGALAVFDSYSTLAHYLDLPLRREFS